MHSWISGDIIYEYREPALRYCGACYGMILGLRWKQCVHGHAWCDQVCTSAYKVKWYTGCDQTGAHAYTANILICKDKK